ncbi:hypothetical protein B0T24DRAFT_632672 [Lasiosphaeria ovina]|uniref:Uncharacterized protein n=1 Tax=Lasiosphaeria ovina TaxID=92902 RepID=A0AAE0K4U6_9PEZI|nr:hypothetical protein B0T24DRAFT_632672 [Lasiosphaeria ovina]
MSNRGGTREKGSASGAGNPGKLDRNLSAERGLLLACLLACVLAWLLSCRMGRVRKRLHVDDILCSSHLTTTLWIREPVAYRKHAMTAWASGDMGRERYKYTGAQDESRRGSVRCRLCSVRIRICARFQVSGAYHVLSWWNCRRRRPILSLDVWTPAHRHCFGPRLQKET